MDIPPDRTALAGVVSDTNPMGTDGFEFVEFTGPDVPALEALFARLGFAPVARHRSKAVTLWRQGGVNFILNVEPGSFAQSFSANTAPLPAPWPSASWTRTRR
jgi:4-hydroxyphenylpyruvate dioxygenase